MSNLLKLAGAPFAKMTGTGNDFIIMDGRKVSAAADDIPLMAEALCRRRQSAGADGLMVLIPSERVDPAYGKIDFRWEFFNSDGSSAEMCGNGARCAARFAHGQGLAGPEMVFDTLAGPIRAWVLEGGRVRIQMVPPSGAYFGQELKAADQGLIVDGVNTGVPHAVLTVTDIDEAQVVRLGRALRFHENFQPAGTNVNFAALEGGRLLVRTYERGVEDETLACGTGAVAAALVVGHKGLMQSPVRVKVKSGEELTVSFTSDGEGFGEVFLEGPASYVYEGVVNREAFDWLMVSDKE